jgi:hypothetical protein
MDLYPGENYSGSLSNKSGFEEGDFMKNNIQRIMKIIFGIMLACIVLFGFLYFNNDIGVQKSKLEEDIRSSQKIEDGWIVDGTISDAMAAYISYPEDKSDHTYSVYVNRPGLSFGYFFRGGGSISGVDKYIAEYTVEGCNERAFLSMNNQKVERLEIDDGTSVQTIDIDSNKPFAIILPVNAGNVTFFDVDGNEVDFEKHSL